MKAIAHSTNTRLYEKVRRRLMALAEEAGLTLWQRYERLAPRLAGPLRRDPRGGAMFSGD